MYLKYKIQHRFMYFVFYKILYKIQNCTMANIFSKHHVFKHCHNYVHIDIFEVVSIWMQAKVDSTATVDEALAHLRNTSYIRHQNALCIFCSSKNKIQIRQNVLQIQIQNTFSKCFSNTKDKTQICILNTYFKYLHLKYYPAL